MHGTGDEYRDQLASMATVSDKIRFLDQQGLERAEIARMLGKRYQHVRNVLEQDLRKKRKAMEEEEVTGGQYRVFVEANGTISLPEEILAQLDLGASRMLTVRVEDGELRGISPGAALTNFRKLVKELNLDGRKIVDEFIAEKRQEAANE